MVETTLANVGETTVGGVAAGSVVKEGQIVGPYSLVAGTPAVLKKEFTKEDISRFQGPVKNYRRLAEEHMKLKI